MKKFSIIIPVLNEERCIKTILQSLNKQSAKNFDLIVVDNGSTDKSVEIIKSEKPKLDYPLSIVFCKKRGISYARNFGARKAGGEYLVFFDADGKVDKHWFRNAAIILQEEKALVISGFIFYTSKSILKYLLYNSYSFFLQQLVFFLQKTVRTTYHFQGNNMAINKVFFMELGGFPHIVGEDVGLTQTALKRVDDRRSFLSSKKLKVSYSPRRFEQKGFLRTLLGWLVDYKRGKNSSRYDIYR